MEAFDFDCGASLNLPYTLQAIHGWLNLRSGNVDNSEELESHGKAVKIVSPDHDEDVP